MPNTLHVLIATDDPMDADRILGVLEQAGFDVHAKHVQNRQQFLAGLQGQIDLIITGYHLSEFSALEALQLLQEDSLDIPLIVVPHSVGEEAAVQCVKSGAFHYILADRLTLLGPSTRQAADKTRQAASGQVTKEEMQRRNRELTLLNQIAAASVSDPEPENLLHTACRELALAFGVPHTAAFLFDDRRQTATFVAEHAPPRWDRFVETSVPVARNPVFEHILSQRTPLVANNGPNDPRLEPLRDLLIRSETSSLLVLPLAMGTKVMGGIGLRSVEPYEFTVQQVGVAWRVADQLSGAITRARLDKDRRLLTAAIRQTAEGVIITDPEGAIVYVNPGFEQMSGYSRTEALGQNPRILKSGERGEAFYRDLWDTLSAGHRWRGRFVDKKKDGTLYTVDSSITPVRDDRGRIVNYVDVQRDVTRELQLEEQYQQAQKMEVVGRLAGGIAHDFNNLLTAIKGYTGLLLGTLGAEDLSAWPGADLDRSTPLSASDMEMMRSDLEEVDRATDQAASLVRRLMAFSRKQVLQPQVLGLNAVVTDSEKMLRRLIGEDVEPSTKLDPRLGWIRADPGQIEQVIVNLAVNARDAMPGGGTFTIETRNVALGESDAAQHPDIEPGEYVLLSVSDTGIGMTREVRAHLFEPFFTTKEVGKGTGLGLATVHGIIIESKGHIEVVSEVGVGTTFRIYLPCVAAGAATDSEAKTIEALPRGEETVLVVEDEEFVRDLTTRVLELQGYNVLSAGHPEEALRWAEEYEGPIHLLLTDVIMPGMFGTELARTLSALRPGLQILYVSGYTDDTIAQRGVLDPQVAFLAKPFTARALAHKVRQVLDAS